MRHTHTLTQKHADRGGERQKNIKIEGERNREIRGRNRNTERGRYKQIYKECIQKYEEKGRREEGKNAKNRRIFSTKKIVLKIKKW